MQLCFYFQFYIYTNIMNSNFFFISFFCTADGYVYKLVEWYDRLGEEHSNLVDIFEATVPDAVRAIEISSKVSNKIIVFETNDFFFQVFAFHLKT